jgi:peptidoglycan/xylan/chitin deacetylase (PgdA/CDA1 family)
MVDRRDFLGHGETSLNWRWPDDARVAVSLVLNFEEGAEFTIGDGDLRNETVYEVESEQFVVDPCIESHFEYGTRSGYWRIARVMAEHGVSCTVSACGRAVERSPWLIHHAVAQGHEIAAHGYRWQSHAGMSEADERATIKRTIAAIEREAGTRPLGWHTRSSPSVNTRRLLIEEGFLYDSDAYNDDLPSVIPMPGRTPYVVVPYAFDTNDMQFQHTDRFATASAFAEYVCDAYDWLWREGATHPRMLSIGLHLRMIGKPGRIIALEKILNHIEAKGGAWMATREQIARHRLSVNG